MHTPSRSAIFSILLLGIAASWSASAAEPDKASRERELVRRAQQELRRVQTENTSLEADKAQLEAALKQAQQQIAGLKGESQARGQALEAQVSQLRRGDAERATQLQEKADAIEVLKRSRAETEQRLEQAKAEAAQHESARAQTASSLDACETKNAQLFQYSTALLQAYRDKGVLEAFSQREPVLGLADVRIQNTVQEYQDKLAAQKIPAAQEAVSK